MIEISLNNNNAVKEEANLIVDNNASITENQGNKLEENVESKHCFCGSSHEWGFMICCEICERWYHGSCVGLKEEEDAEDIEEYHCIKCAPTHGPSKMKRKSVRKRKVHNYSVLDDGDLSDKKIVKPASDFIGFMKQKENVISKENIVKEIKGEDLNLQYFEANGFRTPLVIPNVESLGMKIPESTFTVDNVRDLVGADRLLDVIEVNTQSEVLPQWDLGRWARYYRHKRRKAAYNVISLEFSNTPLSDIVIAPQVVREMDWIDNIWISKEGTHWPKVQKYCLMSVGGSYTDFHIDFGGSSVWYHVLKGQKLFIFVPPTSHNLQAYKEWSSSIDQSDVFFGETADKCYYFVVNPGQTLMIPSGWIHAVYTPVDSLVFGGNFLHNYAITTQFEIQKIEEETQVPHKFRFPFFGEMMWKVALNHINRLKNEHPPILRWEYEGLIDLLATLKSWMDKKKEEIPLEVKDPKSVLEELSALISAETVPEEIKDKQPWNAQIIENESQGKGLESIVEFLERVEQEKKKAETVVYKDDFSDEELFGEKEESVETDEPAYLDDGELSESEFQMDLESSIVPQQEKKRLKKKPVLRSSGNNVSNKVAKRLDDSPLNPIGGSPTPRSLVSPKRSLANSALGSGGSVYDPLPVVPSFSFPISTSQPQKIKGTAKQRLAKKLGVKIKR
eukprot:TRINITY_DN8301_c0_g1_i4.p1 TRINITY_DN8301_c0_g1~~TRINITY_DN8301_c0_g1_i4.p1  ORF type:complete len:676 (+),score=187.06 TRINITY_DN8301_c0_g1_i4:3029-5056(+)